MTRSVLVVGVGVLVLACGDQMVPSEPEVHAGGSPSLPARGSGGGTAGVSFAMEVMPIFQHNCTLSPLCHGQVGNAEEEDLYLGNFDGDTSGTQIHDLLVGVPSKEDPSMNLVAAGDPANSYLWHKVAGDQNSDPAVASGCAKAPHPCELCTASEPCGQTEPFLGAPLSAVDLGLIQNWIAEGARNN